MITDEASDDIAAAIKCNPHLNEFRINKNELTQLNSIRVACATNRNLTTDIYLSTLYCRQ